MDNKKYLDKVIEHLVRGTKIDYENTRITFPFLLSSLPFHYTSFPWSPLLFSDFIPFYSYCENQFGLTDDEIRYVWKGYKSTILRGFVK